MRVEKRNRTKLTPEQCAEIKRKSDDGARTYRLANEYKVNINRIKTIILTGQDK